MYINTKTITTEAQIATGHEIHTLSKCVWQSGEGGGTIQESTPGDVYTIIQ